MGRFSLIWIFLFFLSTTEPQLFQAPQTLFQQTERLFQQPQQLFQQAQQSFRQPQQLFQQSQEFLQQSQQLLPQPQDFQQSQLLEQAERVSQKKIPPVSDVGFCECQALPFITGGPRALVQLFPRFGTKFILYTRSNNGRNGIQIERGDTQTLASSGYDPRLPLTVISHGWTESPDETEWIQELRQTLQSNVQTNILVVDWSAYSQRDYTTAAFFTRFVGQSLATFLEFLQSNIPNFSGDKVHLIGFSMGCHVSGIAGNRFPGIARITGLDPAGPNFECVSSRNRLDSSDAAFVDIYHSNAGCIDRGHIGYRTPLGHQDFYINGGGSQPGCRPLVADIIIDSLLFRWPNVCHHTRAIRHYIDSITVGPNVFGTNCDDYRTFQRGGCENNLKAVFGYHASRQGVPRSQGPLPLFLTTGPGFF